MTVNWMSVWVSQELSAFPVTKVQYISEARLVLVNRDTEVHHDFPSSLPQSSKLHLTLTN